MINELDGKLMKELSVSRLKTKTFLTDDNEGNEKNKRHKKICHDTNT